MCAERAFAVALPSFTGVEDAPCLSWLSYCVVVPGQLLIRLGLLAGGAEGEPAEPFTGD